MKDCFGYIRVSTQKQGEGVSLDAQKDAITSFAASNNLRVIDWFEEKETAVKSGRPIFNRMLRELRCGHASGLIMHKIDRSARNLKDWAIVSELPDIGVDVYIATESLDFRSRGGRLTADIQAVIAADYIRNLREETIKGITGRLKQGLYPFGAPIGYLDQGKGNPKTICSIKGPLVRQAFKLYVTGEYSYRTLQTELELRGLRNKAGKPVTLAGIETMLRNPFYCGIIEIKTTGATYKGAHEPLITTRTFKRVQEIRAGKAGRKTTRHNHLYRGLFRCGLCDLPMTPELQKGHVYYRCHGPRCATRTVREEILDEAIQHHLKHLEFTPEDEQQLRERFEHWLTSKERLSNRTSLELRIAKIDGQLERLTDLLIDETLPRSDFERRKKTLMLERTDLEEALHEASKNELSGDTLEEYIELMKSLIKLHISSTDAEKRTMAEKLFSNRTVREEYVVLEPHNWLADREFSDLSSVVPLVETLIELLPKKDRKKKPDEIPQWKHNLKNQKTDERDVV